MRKKGMKWGLSTSGIRGKNDGKNGSLQQSFLLTNNRIFRVDEGNRSEDY